jgi:hypothetical protein
MAMDMAPPWTNTTLMSPDDNRQMKTLRLDYFNTFLFSQAKYIKKKVDFFVCFVPSPHHC